MDRPLLQCSPQSDLAETDAAKKLKTAIKSICPDKDARGRDSVRLTIAFRLGIWPNLPPVVCGPNRSWSRPIEAANCCSHSEVPTHRRTGAIKTSASQLRTMCVKM